MSRFDSKDPAEKVTLTFDLALGLDAGETLNGTPTATVSMSMGSDPTPAAIINGAAALDAGKTKVYVPVQGGLVDCDYLIKVVASTTNAAKVLAMSAILPVRVI